jgi:tRNA (cytidine/uridine-2'-O-)-methyltransferase
MPSQPHDRLTAMERVKDAPLHIVLFEPEIPPNTGNVARLCAGTGCALHLIEPLGFRIDDRELKRAGLDYWHNLNVVMHESLESFQLDTRERRKWYLSTRSRRNYSDAAYEFGDMLVFGKETKGLPQALLDADPEHSLRIPIRHGAVRSLNLSTAVGIVTYGALARLGFPGLS